MKSLGPGVITRILVPEGFHIAPNGILIPTDDKGKVKGFGYCEFSSPEDAARALKKNNDMMGHRLVTTTKGMCSSWSAGVLWEEWANTVSL